jgi:N-acetylmuramoyl-L-alanine amidase
MPPLSSLSNRDTAVSLIAGFMIGLSLMRCSDKPNNAKASQVKEPTLAVDTINTISDIKLQLTEQYCEENYGVKRYQLESPKMIVVHYTVIPTLQETIQYFSKDSIAVDRTQIRKFSRLNVGIHYVIDKNGRIYNLLPDSVVARHIIGFNHVALGIENIAKDSMDLTAAQLESNVNLIRFLGARHSSIQYLIGHHEYDQVHLPHYKLFRSVNAGYAPYRKTDPGLQFMKQIRHRLSATYDLAYEK